MSLQLATTLVETLPAGRDVLFNPWADISEMDTEFNSPAIKRARLGQHLDCDARLILVGEAPGYQGAVASGLAFTSERLLLEGAIPRISRPGGRLTSRSLPWSEPSATIVWKTLYRLGVAERTVLWNAVQLHPVGSRGPQSNRTPTDAELQLGAPALRMLRASFPDALMIAVGRKAELAMASVGIQAHCAVRHPANGGATEFSNGLQSALAGLKL